MQLAIVLKGAVSLAIATIISADCTGLATAGFALCLALEVRFGKNASGLEKVKSGNKIIFNYLSCIFNMNILARFLMY